MLCESRLWSMTYSQLEKVDPLPPGTVPRGDAATAALSASTCHSALMHHSSHRQTGTHDRRPSEDSVPTETPISPLQSLGLQRAWPGRQISAEMEIPGQAFPGGDVHFLVPSTCQSIWQNYSDLHIGGDQVLPLSDHDGKLMLRNESQAVGPFLQSHDVLPAAEDSQAGPLCPRRGESTRWRRGSGRVRSFLFQGREGPFSNSLLNHYLEQKLMDLYRQYMLESMARGVGGGFTFPLPGLEQISLQLSQEGNLEAGLSKDMVLSCLLRVASELQSSEISTPFLQISSEASKDHTTDASEEQAQHRESPGSSEPPVKDVLRFSLP